MPHCIARNTRRDALLCMLGMALWPATALSQEWPGKPLTFVVPFPAGGSNDIAARTVAEGVRKRLNQSVVIENKAGANGALGVETVLRSARDHHTFLVASDSVSLLPLFRSTPWDLTRTFIPVAALSFQPIVVVTAPATGLKSIKDLQATAKSQPNKLSYASSGQGSIQHLVGELFSQQLGIDLLHIPYKGGGQAVNDVLGGQVTAAVLGAAAVLPHIKAGRLVALAVSTPKRSAMLPDTPTLIESGAAGVAVAQWSGVFALEGTPAPILAKLRSSILETLAEPDTRQRFTNSAMEISTVTPEAFQQQMAQDRDRWAKLIKERKISLE
jgi:tripartite-type tricarboxylate transporter receptor subunit TctC